MFHLPEQVRRRMERLREELADSGIEVPPWQESPLLREIDRARFPHRHERRFASYGAIVTTDPESTIAALRSLGALLRSAPKDAARQVRAMADGVQSFSLLTPGSASLVLLPEPVVREMQLVRLRRALGPTATIVSRTDDGTVRVFDQHQIVIFDGTRWWTKPDANGYTVSVCRAAPNAPQSTTQSILDFCVHTAGPGAGGTMLVWCLDGESVDGFRQRSFPTGHRVPLDLPLTEPAAHCSARHVLVQIDGAGTLDREGRLVEVGVHLRPSTRAHELVDVPAHLGTRHAAAMRTSFDVPTAVFFVVSEDGPVTVYARGETIASIHMDTDDRTDDLTGTT